MIDVVTWKWRPADGPGVFNAMHVNALRGALEENLRLPHQLWCITDDPAGIDARVRVLPLPAGLNHTPRCRRRMRIFDREFAVSIGPRILAMDLDMVITGDITNLVDRPEPLVCVRIAYAKVMSGSFILMDAGVLHALWLRYRDDPEGYPVKAQPLGVGSDQAMLNHFLRTDPARPRKVATWKESDGFAVFFGKGYERFEHLGVGPGQPHLPHGCKVVILGGADLDALKDPRYEWIARHWTPHAMALPAEGVHQ